MATKHDDRKVVLTRLDKPIAEAVSATAARLRMSTNNYVRDSLVRAVALDADKVAESNKDHSEEIERLAAGETGSSSKRMGHRGDRVSSSRR